MWAIPGEVGDLIFNTTSQTVSWTAPLAPGGVTVLYDTLRSTDPDDFVNSGVCAETDGADTFFIETLNPPPGMLFSYLVRAVNVCGDGSLSTDSSGTPRQGVSCP